MGCYEVTARLGEGGMGEVYRARDTKLDRDVAIKILPQIFARDAERLARFEREAKTLAALNHPHIAQIYALENLGANGSALVMELVEGEDLSQRIARGAISVDEALPIARQIADALEAAHEQGIVHRDLKPANIKVRPDGTVKVLDFGLAKAIESGSGTGIGSSSASISPTMMSPAHMTGLGVILGTVSYMAPEQAKGRAVDRRADIWAWGCVLYEMLTGHAPFSGEGASDILAKVIEREPDLARLPPDTPPSVVRVLRRCLQKDVRLRFQHIGDARLDLDQPIAESSAATAPAARVSRLVKVLPWAVALAASLVAAAMGWRTTSSSAPLRVSSVEFSYPEGVEALNSIQTIAIAPDGRTIATIGSKKGARALFLRSADGVDATPVARPANPNNVVFSPDGTRLGVLAVGGDLWQVSPSDNDASVVAKGVDNSACGLSWSPHALVFCRAGALWAAAPGGGQERQLTTLDTNRDEVSHEGPIIVNDRVVLFGSLTSRDGADRIEAVPLVGGPRTVVVDRAVRPMMSPSGHLLFMRDGVFMAAPFDARTGSVTGAARMVGSAAGLSKGELTPYPAPVLSANGTLLRPAPGFNFQQVIVIDRQGAARSLGVAAGRFENPRVTQDGSRLLLSDQTMLYVLDIGRGTMTTVAGPAAVIAFASWSLDGSRAIFRGSTGLAWVATAGTRRTGHIPHTGSNDYPSAAGTDADSVLVTGAGSGTGSDVYLISLSGAFEPRALVQSRAYDGGASFSPDRRWLLYQSAESGAAEIYIRAYPSLDRAWQVSAGGGVQARWNPSGKEIFYRNGSRMLGVSIDLSRSEPVLQKPVVLFESEGYGISVATPNYDVMPDGRFIMLRPLPGANRLILTTNWVDELTKALASGAGQDLR